MKNAEKNRPWTHRPLDTPIRQTLYSIYTVCIYVITHKVCPVCPVCPTASTRLANDGHTPATPRAHHRALTVAVLATVLALLACRQSGHAGAIRGAALGQDACEYRQGVRAVVTSRDGATALVVCGDGYSTEVR